MKLPFAMPMRSSDQRIAVPASTGRRRSLALIAAGCLAACNQSDTSQQSDPQPIGLEHPTDKSEVIARLSGMTITSADVDESVRIPLADLDMQRFRLRRAALEQTVFDWLAELPGTIHSAELLIEPPAPPLFAIDADPRRVRPPGPTPVTIVVFCNFESPHCARFEITLSQILPLFLGVVRVAPRDLPLPFHRNAGLAAEAARCAADQGRYWQLHDLLYAHRGALDAPSLQGTAALAALDLDDFTECLDSGEHAASVEADARTARNVGIDTVPTVFINGRYLSPPVSAADLIWRIETELDAAGVKSPRQLHVTRESNLPIEVRSVLYSALPGQGVALLAPAGSSRAQAYREGDLVGPQVILSHVVASGVILWHEGSIEKLALGQPMTTREGATPQDLAPEDVPITPHRAVPVFLDRDRVLVLLSDRIALEAALEPVPMTAGGNRQLRIDEVSPGSLYELLGLKPGDVLLGVNEQPVHEGSNPLWDALEREDEVRVRVMRPGGLASHSTYRFEN